jgi:hypothetical protein
MRHTVISAEAVAIALASLLLHRMNTQHVSFYSNSSPLVAFLNSQDHSNPPNWRMKIHTQLFDNSTLNRRSQVLKIDRNLNATTDNLARLAFSSPVV